MDNEKQIALNKQSIENLHDCYEEVKNDVKEIKDKLLKRPSWAVTVIITILSSVCIGLIVNTLR